MQYQDISRASIQLWYLCCETGEWSQSAKDGVEKYRQTPRYSHHPLTHRNNSHMTNSKDAYFLHSTLSTIWKLLTRLERNIFPKFAVQPKLFSF